MVVVVGKVWRWCSVIIVDWLWWVKCVGRWWMQWLKSVGWW